MRIVLAAHHRRHQGRTGRAHVNFQINAVLLEDAGLVAEIKRRHVGHRNEAGLNRDGCLRRIGRRCGVRAQHECHEKTKRDAVVSEE